MQPASQGGARQGGADQVVQRKQRRSVQFMSTPWDLFIYLTAPPIKKKHHLPIERSIPSQEGNGSSRLPTILIDLTWLDHHNRLEWYRIKPNSSESPIKPGVDNAQHLISRRWCPRTTEWPIDKLRRSSICIRMAPKTIIHKIINVYDPNEIYQTEWRYCSVRMQCNPIRSNPIRYERTRVRDDARWIEWIWFEQNDIMIFPQTRLYQSTNKLNSRTNLSNSLGCRLGVWSWPEQETDLIGINI